MKTIVICNKVNNIDLPYVPKRKFSFFSNLKESYIYHLNNTDVDSYIIDCTYIIGDELIQVVENILFLNDLVSIFLMNLSSSIVYFSSKHELIFIDSMNRLEDELLLIQTDQRKFNRIQWPVNVIIWKDDNISEKFPGQVLSISCGGCFIRSEKIFQQKMILYLEVFFTHFSFISECHVVRTTSNGFAVEFLYVTDSTKKSIQEIINNKILSEFIDNQDYISIA